MAENGREIPEQLKTTADKEARLRNLKEKQNEERQRKLEEIKAQALAAQRFKEQKEQERRKRLEEFRIKDDIRRQQVEDRKKAITEAERDRLESIIRRNHEREARMEAKKRNERSSIVFAFGSSTPRMLDPTDMSMSFWGQRRAASTQNITSATSAVTSMPPLTRRQSERDLDSGSKKRATSAGGLERTSESSTPTTPAGCASGYLGRRRTDLVPTVPSRDGLASSTPRKSLTHSPGRAYSMTRLDQLARPRHRVDLPVVSENMGNSSHLLSSPRPTSITRSMGHLAGRRRPLGEADSCSMRQLPRDTRGIVQPRVNRATQLRQMKLLTSATCSEASSRPSSSLSQQSTTSIASSVGGVRHRPSTAPRRPRPASIAVTGVSQERLTNDDKSDPRPPLPRQRKSTAKTSTPKLKSPVEMPAKPSDKQEVKANEDKPKPENAAPKVEPTVPTKPVDIQPKKEEEKVEGVVRAADDVIVRTAEFIQVESKQEIVVPETGVENNLTETPASEKQEELVEKENKTNPNQLVEAFDHKPPPDDSLIDTSTSLKINTQKEESNVLKENDAINAEMTNSMMKPRITTEEEAKAALAEKRRLAREEAERQAEFERQRIENERLAELEKQRKEEEEIRQLVELQRQAEQERLEEAIREAQKREEEEKLKRDEEQRLKELKEEAERKAKEEAERQKAELQERLKNEEKEREARRKRVEAIMLRTRGKNNSNLSSQQNSEDKNENNPENKKVDQESNVKDENKVNENKTNGTKQENGTTDNSTNGKTMEIVDNIIPDETVKNANSEDVTRTDTINSNNSWPQPAQQYDSLM